MSLTLTQSKRHHPKILTGVCAGVLTLTACQSQPEQSVTNEFPVFANVPSDNDIPDVELDEPALEDINEHYYRYLGVRGATEFYMARTDHDDTVQQGLCFIAVDTESNEAFSECKDPDELAPMVIQLDDPVEAFLIPEYAHADDLPEGWAQVRTNVIVITDAEAAPQEAEIFLPGSDRLEAYTLQRD